MPLEARNFVTCLQRHGISPYNCKQLPPVTLCASFVRVVELVVSHSGTDQGFDSKESNSNKAGLGGGWDHKKLLTVILIRMLHGCMVARSMEQFLINWHRATMHHFVFFINKMLHFGDLVQHHQNSVTNHIKP
jgi:hypothetical protein